MIKTIGNWYYNHPRGQTTGRTVRRLGFGRTFGGRSGATVHPRTAQPVAGPNQDPQSIHSGARVYAHPRRRLGGDGGLDRWTGSEDAPQRNDGVVGQTAAATADRA